MTAPRCACGLKTRPQTPSFQRIQGLRRKHVAGSGYDMDMASEKILQEAVCFPHFHLSSGLDILASVKTSVPVAQQCSHSLWLESSHIFDRAIQRRVAELAGGELEHGVPKASQVNGRRGNGSGNAFPPPPKRHVSGVPSHLGGILGFPLGSKRIFILPKPARHRGRMWTLHAVAGYRDGHAAQEPLCGCVGALLELSDARAWRRRQARASDVAGRTLITAFRA